LASKLVRSEQSPMIPCSAELPQAAFDASNFNQSALTGARVGGPAVAKPRDGGFSDGTSTDLPDRDGGAATLFRRSGRLARCAEPDLLLTAVNSCNGATDGGAYVCRDEAKRAEMRATRSSQ
jgi:hypothetical protein